MRSVLRSRLIALALSLIMTVSVLPSAAFAVDDGLSGTPSIEYVDDQTGGEATPSGDKQGDDENTPDGEESGDTGSDKQPGDVSESGEQSEDTSSDSEFDEDKQQEDDGSLDEDDGLSEGDEIDSDGLGEELPIQQAPQKVPEMPENGIEMLGLMPEDGAVTVYVANSVNGGSDFNDGATVDHPMLSIRSAIDAAVAAGATDITVSLLSDMTITRTLRFQDAGVSVTVVGNSNKISYDGAQPVGLGTGAIEISDGAEVTFNNVALTRMDGSEQAACLVYVQNAVAVLDDVSLYNGYQGDADVYNGGSALYVADGADVTVQNGTRVYDNRPVGSNTSGAIFVAENGSLDVTGIRVFDNEQATYGTGLYAADGSDVDIYTTGSEISIEDDMYIEAGASVSVGADSISDSAKIRLANVFLETEDTSAKRMATLDISGHTNQSDINIEMRDDDGFSHFPYRLIANEDGYTVTNEPLADKDEYGWEDIDGQYDIRYMTYNGVSGLYLYYFTVDAVFEDVSTLTGIDGKDINGGDVNYYDGLEVANSYLDNGDTELVIPELIATDDGDFTFTFTTDEAGKDYRIPTPDQVHVMIDGTSELKGGDDYLYTPDYDAGTATLTVFAEALSGEKAPKDEIRFQISGEKYYKLNLELDGPLYTMETSITGQKQTSTMVVSEDISADGSTYTYRVERPAGTPVQGVTIRLFQEVMGDGDDGSHSAPTIDTNNPAATMSTDESGYVVFTGLDSASTYFPIVYYTDSYYVIARDVVTVQLSTLEGQRMSGTCGYNDSVVDVVYNRQDDQNWSSALSTISNTTADTTVAYYIEMATDIVKFHANYPEDCTVQDTANYYFNGASYDADTHNPFTKKMAASDETYGELPTMTMTGYDFVGWFTAPDGGEQVVSSTAYETSSSVKDLYAHWTPKFVKYTIEHWFELSPLHAGVTHADANPNYNQDSKIVKKDGKTYYVFYTEVFTADTANGAGDNIADSWIATLAGHELTDASSVITALQGDTYSWWTMAGLTAHPDTNVQVLADGTSVFGIYYDRNIYNINFDPREGTMNGDRTSQQAKFGGDLGSDLTSGLPGLLTASRPGYTFGGWYTTDGEGREIRVTATSWYTWTQDINVYAKWLQSNTTYTIKIATEDKSYDESGLAYADDTYTLFKTVANQPGISDQLTVVNLADIAGLEVPGFTYTGYSYGLTTDGLNAFDESGAGKVAANDGTFTVTPNEFGTTIVYLYFDRNKTTVTIWDDAKDENPEVFETVDIVYGDDFTPVLPEVNPTKPGYDFSGWVDASGNPVDGNTVTDDYTQGGLSGTMDLYPVWTARQYFVTYVPGVGATFDVSSLSSDYQVDSDVTGGYVLNKPVTFGEKMGNMPTASKPGYRFDGWFVAEGPNMDTQVTSDTIVGIDNIIEKNDGNTFEDTYYLVAKFTPYSFNLTLNPNGGRFEGSPSTNYTVTYGEAIPELPTPVKDGYTFVGWMLNVDDAAGTYIKSGDVWTYLTTEGATVEAVATWVANKYTFTFNLNDVSEGNGSTVATLMDSTISGVDIEFGGPFAEVVNGIVASRNGYLFEGWSTSKDRADLITSENDAVLTNPNENTTLYAIWKPIVIEVRFYMNGGEFADSTALHPNWNAYAAKYYEAYEAIYGTVMEPSYNADEDYYSVPVIFDTDYSDLGTPVKEGSNYAFNGWLAYAPGWYVADTPVIHGKVITTMPTMTDHIDDVISLYAVWGAHMTFVIPQDGINVGAAFDGHEGTSWTISKADLQSMGKLPGVVKDGYLLYGWKDTTTGEFVDLAGVLDMDEHHTFEAVMTPAITFDGNGGQVQLGNQRYDSYTIGLRDLMEHYDALPYAYKDGVTFLRWLTNDGTDVTSLSNLANRTEPLVLTAIYDVQVTFVIPDGATWSDGTSYMSKSYTISEIRSWSELPTANLTGYDFMGWYYDDRSKVQGIAELVNRDTSVTVTAFFSVKGSGGDVTPPEEDGINIVVTDYTKGDAVWTEPADGWKAGTNQFTVTCDDACAVALVRDEVATELSCVASGDGTNTYVFTADGLVDGDEIVIVKRGDVTLDGKVQAIDAARVAQNVAGVYEFGRTRACVELLAADVHMNGRVQAMDAARIAQAVAGVYVIGWNLAD